MSACYYFLNLLQDYKGKNDAFLMSLVVCKHAIYFFVERQLIFTLVYYLAIWQLEWVFSSGLLKALAQKKWS